MFDTNQLNWTKPTNWGGYKTDKGLFYLADKVGNVLVVENEPEWEIEYKLWITSNKTCKAAIFGFKNENL